MAQDQRGIGFGRRYSRLLARRPRLFRFVVAVVLSRLAFGVLDLVWARVLGIQAVITVLLVVELAVVWRNIAQYREAARAPAHDARDWLDRLLLAVERWGAVTVYATTGAIVVADLVLFARGASHTTLLTVVDVARWAELIVLFAVLYSAGRSVSPMVDQAEAPGAPKLAPGTPDAPGAASAPPGAEPGGDPGSATGPAPGG